jgi:hypothetical protein
MLRSAQPSICASSACLAAAQMDLTMFPVNPTLAAAFPAPRGRL